MILRRPRRRASIGFRCTVLSSYKLQVGLWSPAFFTYVSPRLAWRCGTAVITSGTSLRGVCAGEIPSAALLDCKASTGKLFVPEDTTAVAHGDQNLQISDFLSKI